MEQLKFQTSIDKFFQSFTKYKRRILFLDYDGTLAGFKKERDKAFPYPGVVERLQVLIRSPHTRLIIISGRSLDDLKRLLNLDQFPEMIGGHGAEVFDPKKDSTELKLDQVAQGGLLAAQKWAIQVGLNDFCERKITGIAFHWRGLPENKRIDIEQKIHDKWNTSAGDYNLELHHFDGGIELRYANVNKGIAVESILNKEKVASVVAYLGDDYTDEEAFAQLGTKALKVLVRKEQRKTNADLIIAPPEELLEFLDRWIEADM